MKVIMPYCVPADIDIPSQILLDLTDDDEDDEPDSAIILKVITDADVLIDSYLQSRYTVPISPVPGLIKTISVDISTYNLYARKVLDEFPKAIEKKYNNSIKLLEALRDGKMSLGVTDVKDQGKVVTNKIPSDREFSKEKLRGF